MNSVYVCENVYYTRTLRRSDSLIYFRPCTLLVIIRNVKLFKPVREHWNIFEIALHLLIRNVQLYGTNGGPQMTFNSINQFRSFYCFYFYCSRIWSNWNILFCYTHCMVVNRFRYAFHILTWSMEFYQTTRFTYAPAENVTWRDFHLKLIVHETAIKFSGKKIVLFALFNIFLWRLRNAAFLFVVQSLASPFRTVT